MKTEPDKAVREEDKKEEKGFPYAAMFMLLSLVAGGILIILKLIGII